MRTPSEIDEFIVARVRAGGRPYEIGSALGLPAKDVRARMVALGFPDERDSNDNKYSVHPMWNAGEDQLRKAIWQRQHDGARAALRGKLT